jgi:hypothetical protein
MPAMRVTRTQVSTVREVVRWYLETYYSSADDIGLLSTFTAVNRVGHMAVDRDAIASGVPEALFRLLVTVAMFQRLRDVLVLKILRSLPAAAARELTSARELLALSAGAACEHAHTNRSLIAVCDLTKDPTSRRGTCSVAPERPCYLKGHTELLRRYGHFGKVPTSLALALAEHGATDLSVLRSQVLDFDPDPLLRAQELERRLSDAWRVNRKIASMFLSLVSTPDIGLAAPPWIQGIDWTWYVVVDSNVDLFLASVGYEGPMTYDARREHVRRLAARIDLSDLRRDLVPYNPRLVQQALFMFAGQSNRRAAVADCSKRAGACDTCTPSVRRRCALGPQGKNRARYNKRPGLQ